MKGIKHLLHIFLFLGGVFALGLAAWSIPWVRAELVQAPKTAVVPILCYHHLQEEGQETSTVLRVETFEHQMELLDENGYHPVTFDDLIAFVDRGAPLPEHPVVITFDDGYMSNYTYGFPILQDYGFPAAIFVIGCSVGHETYYKDTQYRLTPHFGEKEIEAMTASGLISIQSHTYDMHQYAPFEEGDRVRETAAPLAGESEQEYIAALTADTQAQNALFASLGLEQSDVFAFPQGVYTDLANQVLCQLGYRVTLTIDSTHVNTLTRDESQSLINLGRLMVSGETTDERLIQYLSMQ